MRQRCSVRHVNLTISMAFIALGLVNAAVRCGGVMASKAGSLVTSG